MHIQTIAKNSVVRFFSFWIFYLGLAIVLLYLAGLILATIAPSATPVKLIPLVIFMRIVGPIGCFVVAVAAFLYAAVQSKTAQKIIMCMGIAFLALGFIAMAGQIFG